MNRLRDWAVRHPRLVDGLLAGLVAAVTLPVTFGGPGAAGVLGHGSGVTGWGWLWFLAVHAPLVWRRRNPILVFWGVLALGACTVLSGVTGVFLVFAPLVALYTVARHGPLRDLAWAASGVVIAFVPAGVGSSPGWNVLSGVFATLVTVALVGLVLQLRRTYLAERARHLRQEAEDDARITVAAERAQIAREVHDIVAHNLAVMVALTDGASATVKTSPDQAADMMQKASMTGRTALGEMRRLVGLLRDGGERAPQPGLADLDELVAQVRAAGLRVEMSYEGVVGTWAPGTGLAVYRIVQEALTNTLKHAGPQARARVRLRCTDTEIEVEITNDGVSGASAPAGGHGLAGIVERARAYGGHAEAGPVPTGWRVHARLPSTGEVT